MHDDINRIDAGVGWTTNHINFPGTNIRSDVKAEGKIRLPEALPESVIEHRARTEAALLGRLHDQHQRTGPLIPTRYHLARRADQARDMHIMSAGMHHRHGIACNRVDLRRGAGLDVLPQLADELDARSVDVVFIDAVKEEYVDYFKLVKPLVAPGGRSR